MDKLLLLMIFSLFSFVASAREYHVAKTGNDDNNGTLHSPLLTIQAAAKFAQPGDVIIVHEGVYRERINPPRGGTSDNERIVYQAAEGQNVEIQGSEIIKNWVKFKGIVWKATIPDSLFGAYNPYKDKIQGDWFADKGWIHHTGEVYMNGKSFWEMEMLEKVLNPKPMIDRWDAEGSVYTWFCESDKEYTYIYANFHEADPNSQFG